MNQLKLGDRVRIVGSTYNTNIGAIHTIIEVRHKDTGEGERCPYYLDIGDKYAPFREKYEKAEIKHLVGGKLWD